MSHTIEKTLFNDVIEKHYLFSLSSKDSSHLTTKLLPMVSLVSKRNFVSCYNTTDRS